MVTMSFVGRQAFLGFALFTFACGSDESPQNGTDYAFNSRFVEGSSVNYQNQVKRQLLVTQLSNYIGGLDDQTFTNPSPGDVSGAIKFHYRFNSDGGDANGALPLSTNLPVMQDNWAALGGPVDLQDKMPDYDLGWDQPMVGWPQAMLPEELLFGFLDELEAVVVARSNGNIPLDPSGTAIERPYVSADGIDYQQLIAKFVLGAVAYSQGTGDYLADDRDGKGLNSPHAEAATSDDGPKPYSELEHAWDEAFGYFGFARDFSDYTLDEVAAKGGREDWQVYHDSDGDGQIDVAAEYNFGHATNTAKRDRTVDAQLGSSAFEAFRAGRALLAETEGELDDAAKAELRGYRDTIVSAWERTVAATVVHYANEVSADVSKFESEDYVFADHAKHWSELKGFALILQFNPHSKLTTTDLDMLHADIGSKPVLPGTATSSMADHQAALGRVKTLLKDRLSFTDEQVSAW